ncbi:MAG: hypothetical protein Q9181_008347, partial [Wetmoreana brouardii]
FCHDHALILYVYLSNDESGADDSVLTRRKQRMNILPLQVNCAHEVDETRQWLRFFLFVLFLAFDASINLFGRFKTMDELERQVAELKARAERVNAKVIERDAMHTSMEEAEQRIEQLLARIEELEAEKAAGAWGEKATGTEGEQAC